MGTGIMNSTLTNTMIASFVCLSCILLLLAGTPLCSALDFEMQTQTKCIFEELNANVIVVGDYKAANRDNPSLPIYVDVKVPVWVGYFSCGPAAGMPLCFTWVLSGMCRCLIQQEALCMRTRHSTRGSLLSQQRPQENTRRASPRMVRSTEQQGC